MYTVCPKCALTLVVTAADLRVAQGFVRCGRCSNVFNALARLSEERHAVAQGVASGTQSLPVPPLPVEATSAGPQAQPGATTSPEQAREQSAPMTQRPEGASAAQEGPKPQLTPVQHGENGDSSSDAALEFNPDATDVTKLFVEQAPDPQWSAATGQFKALLRDTQDTEPAGIATPTEPRAQPAIERDPGFQAEAVRPASEPAQQRPPQKIVSRRVVREQSSLQTAPGQQPLQGSPLPDPQPAPSADPASPPQAMPTRQSPPPPGLQAFAALDAAAQEPAAAPEPAVDRASQHVPHLHSPHLWTGGTIVLAMVLLLQIVHHYRHELAATARFNRALTAAYSVIGIALVPHWNLGAYDVRQLGASADSASAGRIMVRASVKNTADQAQPLPLLRVTLQDRFGNRLAARDVPPRSYLPGAAAAALLLAGQRIDAEMAFVDPGADAVGFEIDACLPAPGGLITCANDPGSR